MYDRDPVLLAHAAVGRYRPSLPMEPRSPSRRGSGTSPGWSRPIWPERPLITAAALLDMLTADELDRFVASCVEAGCPR